MAAAAQMVKVCQSTIIELLPVFPGICAPFVVHA